MDKKSKKQLLKGVLKILITAACLGFLIYKIDFSQALKLLSKANLLWLFLAALLFIVSKFIAAFRLQYFVGAIPLKLSDKFNLKLYWLGMFYNLFLPGGIGGDGYKVYLFNKKFGVPVKRSVQALVVDRANGLLALIIVVCGISIFMEFQLDILNYMWLGIPLTIIGYILGVRLFFKSFFSVAFVPTIHSLLVQSAQAISALCIVYALGVEEGIISYVFIFMLSAFVLMVPVPSFGGLGLRESLMYISATELGIDDQTSVALSFSFFLITALVSLGGIYFNFNPGELAIAEDQSEGQE